MREEEEERKKMDNKLWRKRGIGQRIWIGNKQCFIPKGSDKARPDMKGWGGVVDEEDGKGNRRKEDGKGNRRKEGRKMGRGIKGIGMKEGQWEGDRRNRKE